MDCAKAFEIIYAFAACGGRDAKLFGDSMPYAREAFARGLCGDAFPEIWFELPLAGEPWFDLHTLVARGDVHRGDTYAGLGSPYTDALAWFATSGCTRQLALSFDSHTGAVTNPAVQLLLAGEDVLAPRAFLRAAGCGDLAQAYSAFVRSMPEEWYACYSGVFPSRGGADWVRIEAIAGGEAQKAYAMNPETLRAHLAQVGMSDVSDELLRKISELARTSFPLEFQFNVAPDGTALPVLGASVRFQPGDWLGDARRSTEAVFRKAEDWGLADNRWQQLAQTAFAKRAALRGDVVHLWCFPAFLKLRWRDGLPLDAKAYLIAGSS
ncbi:MAG: hypothetical protein IKG21_07140 [Atopobiaceae bacterium]|nr:hypothetical protein [Atopobiaceae bacterium]